MKKTYINPELTILEIEMEQMLAASLTDPESGLNPGGDPDNIPDEADSKDFGYDVWGEDF